MPSPKHKTKEARTVTIDKDRSAWLKDYLKERGKTFSSLVNELIYEFSASVKTKDKNENKD